MEDLYTATRNPQQRCVQVVGKGRAGNNDALSAEAARPRRLAISPQ